MFLITNNKNRISICLFTIFLFFCGTGLLANTSYAQSSSNVSNNSTLELMEQARKSLNAGDYDKAIRLYTKIINTNNPKYQRLALEFMGVARERKGQLAHAKAIYQDFIKKYPLDSAVPRIKQRLAGLITAASKPKPALKKVQKQTTKESAAFSSFGGVSQYYRYADLTIENDANDSSTSINIESSLSTDLFYIMRGRGQKWNTQLRFSGGYLNDFLSSSNDYGRLSNLSFQLESRDWQHSLQLGRQRGNNGGVFGRFDGINTKFHISKKKNLHFVYGFPVAVTKDVSVNKDKHFYGINMDFGPNFGGWNFNTYVIEQKVESLIDRRAIGLESRYFNNGKSLFTLLDYDIYFEALNTALMIANWQLTGGRNLSATIDFRKSPLLTTSNALQGQINQTLNSLTQTYSEDEIKSIAQDRTADSQLINLGIDQKINNKWTFFGNITRTRFSDMPSSANVEALPGTDNEWSYDLQMIGTGLIKEGDTGIFSLRYFDGSYSSRTSLRTYFRYPMSQALRINPRLRIDLRSSTRDNTDQWAIRPSFKLNYRLQRKYHFEIELGGEWTTREISNSNTENTQGLFGTMGYRIEL